MEEIMHCPLCKSQRKHIFEEVYDSNRQVTYQICRRCGLVYQSPRMEEGELEKFYEREYRIQRQETEEPIEKDLQMQEDQLRGTEIEKHRQMEEHMRKDLNEADDDLRMQKDY